MSGRGRTSMFHTAKSKRLHRRARRYVLFVHYRVRILPPVRTRFLTRLHLPPRARWHAPCSGAAARGTVLHYRSLGAQTNSAVWDIRVQPATATSKRRILVAFRRGSVGVYNGD